MQGLELLEGVLVVIFCWAATTSLVFRINILVEVYICVAALSTCKLAFKGVTAYCEREGEQAYTLHWAEDFGEPLIFLLAVVLMIVRSYVGFKGGEVPLVIF